jgi:hypothetical protein
MPMSDRRPLDERIDRALRRIAGGDGPADLGASVRARIEARAAASRRRPRVAAPFLALAAAGLVALAVGAALWRGAVTLPSPPAPAAAVSIPLAPLAPPASPSAEPAVAGALAAPPAKRSPTVGPRPAIEGGSVVEPLEPPEPLAIERLHWAVAEIDPLRMAGLKVEALPLTPLSPSL